MGTIPVSQIISVTPSVLSAGGNPLALNGLILSESANLPFGPPVSFPSAATVLAYFGAGSLEAQMAATYFGGWTNSTQKPNALLFSRYAAAPIAAFLRGGTISLTLAQLQAIISGTLIVTIDGTVHTASAVNLSTATSFSNAASLLTTALTLTGAAVTWSSQFNAFIITSGTTGATSTMTVASGTTALELGLTTAAGAILSQGAATQTPASAMATLVNYTSNWAGFTSAFEPILSDKEAFATWTSGTNGEFFYVPYDTDITATQTPSAFTGLGAYLVTNSISGVAPVYLDPLLAAFVLGCAASVDYTRTKGRIDYSYKTSSGLVASVTDAISAANLKANGYNYYGAFATAATQWNILYPGQISGPYKSIGAYVDAIWLNAALQLAEMTMFTSVNAVPYDPSGYGLIEEACSGVIAQGVTNGVITQGSVLSASEISTVNLQAGVNISGTLGTIGWYLQVLPASAQSRAAQTTPPCSFWYCGASGVTQLNLASIDVQ